MDSERRSFTLLSDRASWSVVDCDETFTFVLSSNNNMGKSCSSHTEGEKQRECKGEKQGKGRKGKEE